MPLTLRHDEMEHGHYGKSAPIRYVPEQDPVQGSLSEAAVSMNIVKMPGDGVGMATMKPCSTLLSNSAG